MNTDNPEAQLREDFTNTAECIANGVDVAAAVETLMKSAQWFATAKAAEARIDELKRIRPPEQYKEYAKLMGHDACTICGFNSEVFRVHLDYRIAQLTKPQKGEKVVMTNNTPPQGLDELREQIITEITYWVLGSTMAMVNNCNSGMDDEEFSDFLIDYSKHRHKYEDMPEQCDGCNGVKIALDDIMPLIITTFKDLIAQAKPEKQPLAKLVDGQYINLRSLDEISDEQEQWIAGSNDAIDQYEQNLLALLDGKGDL